MVKSKNRDAQNSKRRINKSKIRKKNLQGISNADYEDSLMSNFVGNVKWILCECLFTFSNLILNFFLSIYGFVKTDLKKSFRRKGDSGEVNSRLIVLEGLVEKYCKNIEELECRVQELTSLINSVNAHHPGSKFNNLKSIELAPPPPPPPPPFPLNPSMQPAVKKSCSLTISNVKKPKPFEKRVSISLEDIMSVKLRKTPSLPIRSERVIKITFFQSLYFLINFVLFMHMLNCKLRWC